MKSFIKNLFFVIVALSLIAGTGYTWNQYLSKDDPFGGSTPTRIDLIGTEASNYSLADSTTTEAVEIGAEFDQLDLNLFANASGTETIIFRPLYSNDVGCGSSTDSNIAWFSKGSVSDSSGVITITASSTYFWASPAAGEHFINIPLTDWNAHCLKVELGNSKLDSATQNAVSSTDIWLEIQAKETGN